MPTAPTDHLPLAERLYESVDRARKAYLAGGGVQFTRPAAIAAIAAQLAVELPDVAGKTATKKRAPAGPRIRERDVLFDAIGYAAGLDLSCITRAMAVQVAAAKRDILEATPDVTPDEIARRAAAYTTLYRTIGKPSPMALAKHWSKFSLNPDRPTMHSKRDITIEPPMWRPVAQRLFPDAREWVTAHDFSTMPWREVNPTLREKILKAIP